MIANTKMIIENNITSSSPYRCLMCAFPNSKTPVKRIETTNAIGRGI